MATPNEAIGKRWWLRHLRDQKTFEGHLNVALRDAAKESARIVNASVGDPRISAQIRAVQYQESRSAIYNVETELWGRVSTRTAAGMAKSAERAGAMWREVNRTLGSVINVPAIRREFTTAANHAIENLVSRYVLSIDLSPSVYRHQALAQGLVDRVVNSGLLLNKSAAEIARDVRHLIDPSVSGGVSFAAKRLGRTELNNAFHETTKRIGAAQPWVEAMLWHLSESHPRPDECNDYAGKEFPPNQVPDKPHPQCFCYITAVTPSDSQFLNRLFAGDYDSFLESQV